MNENHRLLVTALALTMLFTGCAAREAEDTTTPAASAQAVIEDALSATLPSIAANARVVDWEGNVLKEGDGTYTCMPTPPQLTGTAPMCMDGPWMTWADAWSNRTDFTISSLGISYMLAGDEGASNIDPFAEGPTDDNQWVVGGPHLMVIVPDPALLEGISTDPSSGGPFVMWKGTPYAHVMVPVELPEATGDDDPIEDALSAAPSSVAANARVVDWEGNVLKEGDGAYTCMPTPPQLTGTAPMCMDDPWMTWADAWSNRTDFTISTLGISYMLAGDEGASNIDPFAEGPTDDNQWVVEGPHLMIIVPDPALLEGIPTDPSGGGPFVMWKGTPYAHVMVPVAD